MDVRKSDRAKIITPVVYGKELYLLAKNICSHQLQNRMYVIKEVEEGNLPLAGETALAEKTMLNPPNICVKALYKKRVKDIQKEDVVYPRWKKLS